MNNNKSQDNNSWADILSNLYIQFHEADRLNQVFDEFNNIDTNDPDNADKFWSKYGARIMRQDLRGVNYKDRLHAGSIYCYRDLLEKLQKKYPQQYKTVHKGTPFFILGCLYLDVGDYDQGLFFIDSAISEDKKKQQQYEKFKNKYDYNYWKDGIASKTIKLEKTTLDFADRLIEKIITILSTAVDEYVNVFKNRKVTSPIYNSTDFMKRISNIDAELDKFRTVISSFVVYILMTDELKNILEIRSSEKGSIEPFLTSLRQGTLIIESLLKIIYPSFNTQNIKFILKDPLVQSDLKITFTNSEIGVIFEDLIKNLNLLHPPISKLSVKRKISNCFDVCSKLRNIVSHNLLLPDKFDSEIFKRLNSALLFSVFYTIEQKF